MSQQSLSSVNITQRNRIMKVMRMRMRELLQAAATVSSAALLPQEVVKVGILHSRTGALAKASVIDAEIVAMDEITAPGGVFGKKIDAVIKDGACDWPTSPERARKVLANDEISTVLGCCILVPQKALLPVAERGKRLRYSTCYEELEQSPKFLYPAQEAPESVVTAVSWLAASCGEKFYLVGSGYIWQREPTRSPNSPSLRPLRRSRAKQPKHVEHIASRLWTLGH